MPMSNKVGALSIGLPDAAATAALAQRIARRLHGGGVLWLRGDLGAGKTTFASALLQTLGVGERIKSPTYSLIESYALPDGATGWHLDLYRIADAAELDYLGLDALADDSALVLVEWPERGAGALPPADLEIALAHVGAGRSAEITARSPRGHDWLAALRSA